MNYRRGFQRLYVLCSAIWIIAVIAVSIHNRPIGQYTMSDVQSVQTANGWQNTADFTASPPEVTGKTLTDSDVAKLDKQAKPKVPFVPPPLNSYQGDAPDDKDHSKESFTPPPLSPESEPANAAASRKFDPDVFMETRRLTRARTEAISIAMGLALLPPAFGYGMLFYVFPWIYRGFRPRTQI